MKLHQLIAISIALFQSFIFFGMDQNQHLFGVEKKKLSFPEPYRQLLVNYCNNKLKEKRIKQLETENAQLLQEIETAQKGNLLVAAQNRDYLKEMAHTTQNIRNLLNIEKQKSLSINEHPIGKHILLEKKIIERTTQPSNRKLIKRSPQSSDTPLTVREKLNGLKILKKQYDNVRETSLLLDKLREEADTAFEQNSSNFDRENHFLCKKINAKYRFIFCPCTRQLAIVDYNSEVPLSKDFTCSGNCQFYKSKDVDTSTETESESDTEEENFTSVLLSKHIIDKITD